MPHQDSGPGEATIDADRSSGSTIVFRLTNFDHDDMDWSYQSRSIAADVLDLKPEHQAFLDEHVGADAPEMSFWLRGTASKVGADDYNLALSRQRAERVQAYLNGWKASLINTEWVGEEMLTKSDDNDDAWDRAVEVVAVRQPSKPPEQAVQPKTPPTNTNFKIKMLAALNAAGGLSIPGATVGFTADAAVFYIWDSMNNLLTPYIFAGVGVGAAVGGATFEGPWTDFSTTLPVSTTDFFGPASFSSTSFLAWSTNRLILNPSVGPAVSIDLQTGITGGFSISATSGVLNQLAGAGPYPWPYAGP